jgi:hypothetical protein
MIMPSKVNAALARPDACVGRRRTMLLRQHSQQDVGACALNLRPSLAVRLAARMEQLAQLETGRVPQTRNARARPDYQTEDRYAT